MSGGDKQGAFVCLPDPVRAERPMLGAHLLGRSPHHKDGCLPLLVAEFAAAGPTDAVVLSPDAPVNQISGGEKRMAAIATILAMEPEAILMDEPSTALDPVNRRTIIRTINRLPQTKLIASHDLDMILETCDRVLLIKNGALVADGPAEEILRDKELLENNRMELPFCLAGYTPKGK